jgi:hypothetical protein
LLAWIWDGDSCMFIYIQIKLFLVKSYECYLYPISNDSINKSTRFDK